MKTREISFRGNSFKISDHGEARGNASWFSHEDESDVRERDWKIDPEDVVLDIGSAYGSYALAALASGASMVRCWNYNEFENQVLKESLALNGWTGKCEIHQVGLWSSPGFLEDIGGTFSEQEGGGRFRVTTLDLELPSPGRVDWLKLDVEGAEVEVLKGGRSLLASSRPKIQVENHQFKDGSIERRVRELLESMRYRHIRTVPYHGVSHSVYEPS